MIAPLLDGRCIGEPRVRAYKYRGQVALPFLRRLIDCNNTLRPTWTALCDGAISQ